MTGDDESDDDDGDLPAILNLKTTQHTAAESEATKVSPKKRGRPAKVPQNVGDEYEPDESPMKRRRHSKGLEDVLVDDDVSTPQEHGLGSKPTQEDDERESDKPARGGRGRPRKSTPVPKSSTDEVPASQGSPLKRKSNRIIAAETHTAERPVRAAAKSATVNITKQSVSCLYLLFI
jgi:hypothetical protein